MAIVTSRLETTIASKANRVAAWFLRLAAFGRKPLRAPWGSSFASGGPTGVAVPTGSLTSRLAWLGFATTTSGDLETVCGSDPRFRSYLGNQGYRGSNGRSLRAKAAVPSVEPARSSEPGCGLPNTRL